MSYLVSLFEGNLYWFYIDAFAKPDIGFKFYELLYVRLASPEIGLNYRSDI